MAGTFNLALGSHQLEKENQLPHPYVHLIGPGAVLRGEIAPPVGLEMWATSMTNAR